MFSHMQTSCQAAHSFEIKHLAPQAAISRLAGTGDFPRLTRGISPKFFRRRRCSPAVSPLITMPLPPAATKRRPSHCRRIEVQSYLRSDGLWDVEGHLTDVWPTPIPVAGGMLPAGEPIHSMWLRLTVDASASIVDVQAVTDAGPYGPACGTIAPDYRQLIGLPVASGYRQAVRRLFGRTAGCTHMNELANVMGSAILQALWDVLTQDPEQRPFSIDGCHALKSDGPQVATFYPRWYRSPAGER
jgi:hypothetical protein